MIKELLQFLNEFFTSSNLNRLHDNYGGGRIFTNPLIGVATGNDSVCLCFLLMNKNELNKT